tara:strand:+ start:1101 stop:2417 length:1317 start_codon:yes stop_codon:yes gene_type:complete
MTETKPYASSLRTKAIAIFKVGDDDKPYANITHLVTHFYHMEDIMSPAFEGRMVIVDNALSLISSMPIQGNEKVTIEVEDTFEQTYTYTYRVWTVTNRVSADRKQIYTLGLISDEGLINEGIKMEIPEGAGGNISKTVNKIVKEAFDQEIFNNEKARNWTKLIPRRQTPFSVIRSIQTKAIPKTKKNKKGTAGFLFWQTREGFNFRSWDGLIVDNSEIPEQDWFYYLISKRDVTSANSIQEIAYISEIDLLKKLREGSYSSRACYFNINTGKYKESVHSIDKVWEQMEHLGSQTNLPKGAIERSFNPTRIISTLVNNEFWYTDSNSASADSKNELKDYQDFYLQQSIARAGLMFHQHLQISITGHLEFQAGDCIELRIPNQQEEALKEGGDAWDPEHSGTFLVKRVTHQCHISGDQAYSVLELIRDSYGIKNKESKVT